jgi:hypothetical protein
MGMVNRTLYAILVLHKWAMTLLIIGQRDCFFFLILAGCSSAIYVYTYMCNELLHICRPILFGVLDRSLALHTLRDGPGSTQLQTSQIRFMTQTIRHN